MMPLTRPQPPACPAFRDGHVLRAAALRAEAAARVESARLHQQAHLPGIVAGLWLEERSDKLVLTSGMAIDGFGRTILVASSTAVNPSTSSVEVWLAYRESPDDAGSSDTPDAPPDRYTEGFCLLFLAPGEFDPCDSSAHPQRPVFLGTIRSGTPDLDGRVYVGAVGGRIESALRRARMLLAPEHPLDLRLFAVGTRVADRGPFTDHLSIESTGTINLFRPTSVANKDGSEVAAVVAGHRPVEFRTCDILDAVVLAGRVLTVGDKIGEFLDRQTTKHERAILDRLKAANPPAVSLLRRAVSVLRRVLDRVVFSSSRTRELIDAVRASNVVLRSATVRAMLDHAADSPRLDVPRLHRLLLEDAFPGQIARLVGDEEPLGLAFVGARAEPTAALPARAYLATVTDKEQTFRELRIEFRDPGKDNHPERYKVAVGTASPDPNKATASVFQPCLTVDATRTVTIFGDLTVRATTGDALGPPPMRVQPAPAAPGTEAPPGTVPSLPVAPFDLVVRRHNASKDASAVRFEVELENTGRADITAVQVHASVFARQNANAEPVREPLARDLIVGPKTKVFLAPDPRKPTERQFVLGLNGDLSSQELTVILSAVGFGPGFVLVSGERKFNVV